MPRLTALNRRQWNVGEFTSADLSVPLNANKVIINFERNSWPVLPGSPPDNEVIRVFASLSFDGGVNWTEVFGAGAAGGDLFSFRDGSLITHSKFSFDLPEPTNPNRMGRVRMVIREKINTQIDVDLETL